MVVGPQKAIEIEIQSIKKTPNWYTQHQCSLIHDHLLGAHPAPGAQDDSLTLVVPVDGCVPTDIIMVECTYHALAEEMVHCLVGKKTQILWNEPTCKKEILRMKQTAFSETCGLCIQRAYWVSILKIKAHISHICLLTLLMLCFRIRYTQIPAEVPRSSIALNDSRWYTRTLALARAHTASLHHKKKKNGHHYTWWLGWQNLLKTRTLLQRVSLANLEVKDQTMMHHGGSYCCCLHRIV